MSEPHQPWRISRSEIVIDTAHLRLRRDAIELPDGSFVEDYYVRESPGFSVVFALTPERNAVLVRQYKHGIGETVLELPAGAIDPGESAAECARRELAEETGYTAEPAAEPELLGSFINDPTSSNSRYHLFLVRNARPTTAQHLDRTERIDVSLANIRDLRGMIRAGTIAVGAQVASIYFALDALGEL